MSALTFFMKAVMMLSVIIGVVVGTRRSEAGNEETPERTVRMINDVGGDLDLTIHCRQGGEDLGEHVVHPRDNYEFTFIPNFWGTNLYSCTFSWQAASHAFDIFKMERDYGQCLTCIWSIRQDRPCRLSNKSHAFDDCFDWNNGINN